MKERYAAICDDILEEEDGFIKNPKFYHSISYIDDTGYHVLIGADLYNYASLPLEVRLQHEQVTVKIDKSLMVACLRFECLYLQRSLERIRNNLPDKAS